MTGFGPPVAFHFTVQFEGDPASELLFQEVGGLATDIDTTPVVEGGENRFVHRLPTALKHSNVVLKRGLTGASAPLVQWCKSVLEGDMSQSIQPKHAEISLINSEGDAIVRWHLKACYPVKWSVGAFDAMKNELAIETVELAYRELKRV